MTYGDMEACIDYEMYEAPDEGGQVRFCSCIL